MRLYPQIADKNRKGTKMKKLSLILLAMVIVMGNTTYYHAEGESLGTVYIGCPAPITGNPYNGEMFQNGVNLACKEINAAGGLLGYKVEPIYVDASTTVDMGINAVNKLLSDNIIGLVGPHFSSQVYAVEASIKAAGIPCLYGGTNVGLSKLGNDFMFRFRASDGINTRNAAMYLVETLGASNVGIMYSSDDFGVGAMEIATNYFDSVDVDWVAEAHNVEDTDVTGQIMKLKASGVDGILMWTQDTPFVVCARQMYELGLVGIPVMTSANLINTSTIELFETDWVGNGNWYCGCDYVSSNPSEVIVNFNNAYEQEYGALPDNWASIYYTGAMLLFEGVKRAGNFDAQAIIAGLRSIEDLELPNGYISCNNENELGYTSSIASLDQDLNPIYITRFGNKPK